METFALSLTLNSVCYFLGCMLVKRAKDEGLEEEDTGHGSPTFCGKVPHPLLWAGFHAAREK
jgi:hypothetical protein